MKKITLIIILLLMVQFSKAQDTCLGATAIAGPGTYAVGVINGTPATLICADNGDNDQASPGPFAEWFIYTPTVAHTVTVTTDIAANTPRKDTRFHIYTGTCGALTCFGGNDDGGLDFSSALTFNVTAGTSYIIAFDNKWLDITQNTGFSFQLTESPVVVPPVTPISYTLQTIPTINSGFNYCIADMNGDHNDDIVGVSNNNLRIHYQGAGGTFTVTDFPIAGTSEMPYWSMAAGDYNRDGKGDLILGAGDGLSVWKSVGTGYTSITPGDYIFCQRTNFADLNNDGNLDIFSCHDVAPNCYYLNGGGTDNSLTFYQSNVTPGAMKFGIGGGNYSTLFTDFDNDGDTDVFISKCSGPPCEMHRNDGNGVYTDISAAAGINVPAQTWSSAIGDFDNDGDMDVIITASSGTHKYFRNNLGTQAAFTNITAGSGWDTNTSLNIDNVTYDFDNDGFLDVLGGGSKIMFNQHNSTFAPISFPGIAIGAIGDLNNDGFLDIQNGNTIRYAVPNGNNWLEVALQGIQTNINGIGARVEVLGSWGIQIRDIRSGEGFKYMSSMNAHFGLGLAGNKAAAAINQVIIRWPSGIVDTLNNVSPNQKIVVVEGSTLAVNTFNNGVFSVYPNPAKNVVNIQLKDNLSVTLKSAAVYDLTGKVVLTTTDLTQPINVETLATGTYILSISDTNNRNYGQKFIKE